LGFYSVSYKPIPSVGEEVCKCRSSKKKDKGWINFKLEYLFRYVAFP
jgi:hypothetical protein